MDISKRLALSYYKTIAVLNQAHQVSLVQHQSTQKIYVKKVLQIYHLPIYEYLSTHPVKGIPRIVDYMEENGQLTVIEEYISGCSLQEKLESGDLTADSIRRYTSELCDILEHLHTLHPPIIHRDIKPSNIMITSCDHVVLLDFNAAKYFKAAASDTTLLGTQGYAAPEQYGFGSSSPRTDIYALGVLLRELCSVLTDSPADLSQISEKCTQMDPENRFSSVKEIKSALYSVKCPSAKRADRFSSSAGAVTSGKRDVLPPGFRTGVLWKKVVAVCSYILLGWLSLSLVIKDEAGHLLPTGQLWFERIFVLLAGLSVICITCDYLHVQKRFQLDHIRQPLLRWLCVIGLDVSAVFFLVLCMVLLESVLFT